MTLKQLRFLREVARQSLNISSAALALHTSQPGVSRQLQELERELGVELLVRRKNRVLALTEAGEAVLLSARRMLDEADNIRLVAEDLRNERGGRLALATSHLHARYTLLAPVKAFTKRYPEVQLHLPAGRPRRRAETHRSERGGRRHQHGRHGRASDAGAAAERRVETQHHHAQRPSARA